MKKEMSTGKVLRIIGAVVDVEFGDGKLPPILGRLQVKNVPQYVSRSSTSLVKKTLILEVCQHLDAFRVRTIALDSTDHLSVGAVCFLS